MNRLILPLILAYVSMVVVQCQGKEDKLETPDPFRYGVRDLGVKELVVGDTSELDRMERGEMPPLNPDGSAPRGYELYETFKNWTVLRNRIPFVRYQDTEEQQLRRAAKRGNVDRAIHRFYDQACPNVSELTDEKYSVYVVNETTGEYIDKTQYFIFAAIYKNYKDMADFTASLNNLSNELNETYPKTYNFAYIDKNVDDNLFHTFNARAEPSVYLLDPKTERAYAMDNSYNKTAPGVVKDWILSGKYKKDYSFRVPQLLNAAQLNRQEWYATIEMVYMRTFGAVINQYLLNSPSINQVFPISLFFKRNYVEEDQFGWTLWRQLKLFGLICFMIGYVNLTIFRMVCCRKYKYVKKVKAKAE